MEENRFLRAYAEHKREREQEKESRRDAGRFECLRGPVHTNQKEETTRFDCLRSDNYMAGSTFTRAYHRQPLTPLPRHKPPTRERVAPVRPDSEYHFPQLVTKQITVSPITSKKQMPESTVLLQTAPIHEYTCLGFKDGKFTREQVVENKKQVLVKPTYTSWANVVKTTYVFDS